MSHGTFEHFQLTDGITADSVDKQMEMLTLADLGYFSLETFAKLSEANVFWIARLKKGVHSLTPKGNPFVYKSGSRHTPQIPLKRTSPLVKQNASKHDSLLRNYPSRKPKNAAQIPCETEKYHTFKGTPPTHRMEYLYHVGADQLTPEQITVIARIRWD